MGGTTTFSVGSDGVAIITINNPPVNSLNSVVLKSLTENFDQALQKDAVKAIVVTGAKGKFSAGYDMNAIDELQEGKAGMQLVHTLSDIMETARKPSVAAINGPALGAGLEVAMFGIIPGGGGTQRLPRLAGLPKAIEMMLKSKPVHGEEAHKFGLVDAIVSEDELLEKARQMALDILASGKPLVSSLKKADKIEPLGKAREILNQARGQAPNLQHIKACLDVIEEGIVWGPDVGLSKEREVFQILLKSDTCKSLVNDFIAQGSARKVQ
ncbi:hypothetical protein M8C21_016907 [Ambrosia artemisiifolia]|uniref:Enoyl-CoA hydratase/isomerase family protein n=1 Tax=Ambrosia artemisiifolia TaxID=4212 RepID=A0AAD5CNB5_AMBAR|nr:hypothetical protein M8C21_016907 [Ambrosia artemisiifolia]